MSFIERLKQRTQQRFADAERRVLERRQQQAPAPTPPAPQRPAGIQQLLKAFQPTIEAMRPITEPLAEIARPIVEPIKTPSRIRIRTKEEQREAQADNWFARMLMPKRVERTGNILQDTLANVQRGLETPAARAVMEPFVAISKGAGGVVTGDIIPRRGETPREFYKRQPQLGEVVSRELDKTGIPVLPIVGGFLAEALLPPYGVGGAGRFADDIIKATTLNAKENIIKKGIKGITNDEATTLARTLTPIKNKRIVQQRLDDFVRAKQQTGATSTKAITPPTLVKTIRDRARVGITPPLEVPPTVGAITPEVPLISAVDKITEALKTVKPLRGVQEKLYAAERARRTARVAAVGGRVGGEAGYFAQLGQLKGELPKVQFESIRRVLTQTEINELFNQIENTAHLLPLEKVGTKAGLAKLLGSEGASVPTRGEIELLRQVFPETFIKAVLDNRPFMQKFWETAGDVANIPRAFMATADLSAPLRQGIFLVGRPRQFLPAIRDMFKFAFSEKAYDGLMEGIMRRPTYRLMRESGLELTDIGRTAKLAHREEQFMSQIGERIPVWGGVIRGSNRAYTGFLNKLRADVFDDLVKRGKEFGVENFDDTARFINNATGRGSLGALERSAVMLNTVFFSPRLMASRLNLINPLFYTQLEPFARKEALKSLLSFGAIAGTVLGLTSLGGAEVGTDPRSADFGKIKVGNTRYDILGGFQQYFRLASQLISGEVVSTVTGRTVTMGEGYKPLTRLGVAGRFLQSKQNPVVSFATSWLQGQNFIGQDFNVASETINRFIPMVWQGLYDIYQERGLEGLGMGAPSLLGVGIQTYGRQELIAGEDMFGQPALQIRPVGGMDRKIAERIFGRGDIGATRGFNIEAYYNQLLEMPPNEAAAIFDKIRNTSPDLAKRIADVAEERVKGVTPKDKDLRAKGVASGDRALAIKRNLDKLPTQEERAALWDEYVRKKIITKEVSDQLMLLLNPQ